MIYKKGDKVILLNSGRIFEVKYIIAEKVVVNNGVFDFPLQPNSFVPYSSLMEELI